MEGGDFEYLVTNYFTKLPIEKPLKIKSDGRPMRVERKKVYRTFREDNYVRTEWLAGSGKLQLMAFLYK